MSSYVVELGDGHCTESGPLGAVTSAIVMDMVDNPATVLVAPGERPARAFDSRPSDATIDAIRDRSIALLIDELASLAAAPLDLTQRNALRWLHGDRGLFMPETSTVDRLVAMGLVGPGPELKVDLPFVAFLARGWLRLTARGLAVLDKIGRRG